MPRPSLLDGAASRPASPRARPRPAPPPAVAVVDTATLAALVGDAVEERVADAVAGALAALGGVGDAMPPILTAAQVGVLLGGISDKAVLRSHARTAARPGGIPCSRPGAATLFLLDDVLAYVKAHQDPNAPR